jgi:hypothetical protein
MDYTLIPPVKTINANGEEKICFYDFSPSMSLQAHCRTEDILSDFAIELKGEKLIKAETDASLEKDGYKIDIAENEIKIIGQCDAAIHYGFCTLVQLALLNDGYIPAGSISDSPDIHFRAVSDDISRGQISTVDGFKSIIRRISYFKYNVYMPYIEDTFRFEFCPDFGKYSDPVPASEWHEICEYAAGFGVSVRPIINLIGHWDKNSKLYDFRDMMLRNGDSVTDVLDVTKKEVRSFVCKMLDEIVDAFGRGVIHAGGDEVADIKKVFGSEKGGRIYVEYFNWLSEELKKRGCTLMMYGDMFLQPYGDYGFDFDLVHTLNEDITVIAWDYALRDSYSSVRFSQSGHKFGISSGTWSWSRFIPQLEVSFGNSKQFIAQTRGMTDIFVLSGWNDGGCCLREEMMPGIAAGGAFAWHYDDSITFERFLRSFNKMYYGYGPDVSDAIKTVYDYDKHFNLDSVYDYAEIGGILFREFWKDARKPTNEQYDLAEHCSELITVIGEAEEVLKENKPLRFKQTYDAFMFDIRRLMWTLMRICVIPSVAFESREEAKSIVDDLIALSEEFELIKKENRRLWMRLNRQSEWNYLESKYIDTEQSLYSLIRYCKYGKNLSLEKYI